MNCENVRPLIDPLSDNELPTETVAQVMEHIAKCVECQDIWNGRIQLKEQFKDLASSINIPEGSIERLDHKIDCETKSFRTRLSNPRPRMLVTIAAAIILLIGICAVVFTVTKPLVTAQQIAADFSSEKAIRSSSIDDTKIKQISKNVGFKVNPPDIDGWKLVSADIYNASNTKLCLARLTYQTEMNGQTKRVTLYQGCSGHFEPSGLQKRVIGGKSICCGQLGDLAIVYWPDGGMDHILVGTMTEKELMSVALSV